MDLKWILPLLLIASPLYAGDPQYSDLLNRGVKVEFQLVQGRLVLNPPIHKTGRAECRLGDVAEIIEVSAKNGLPSLHYRCETPDFQLIVNVSKVYTTRIEYIDSDQRIVVFQQRGRLIEYDLNGKEYEGWTLLHIRAFEPEIFDCTIGPLLDRVLNQSFADFHERTNEEISKRKRGSAIDDQLAELIVKFDSSKSSVRQKAYRQLRNIGTPVIPAIRRVDFSSLNTEQRERLKLVEFSLYRHVQDLPATLAEFMSADFDYHKLEDL